MASTADRMRKAASLMVARGLRVQYSSGWESRSNGGSFNPSVGFIDHHTAATTDIDNVLINGRSDLPGPLCHWALHADGTWVLIAAGGANHAGQSVGGAPTNSTGWGCEATGPNPIEGYGPSVFDNYDSYVTGMACILEAEGWGTAKVWGHKESASPLGRKIDPSFNMDTFRAEVATGGGSGGGGDGMAAWSDADSKNMAKAADNIEKVYRIGFKAMDTSGTIAPTELNNSIRGVNDANDTTNAKLDTLIAAVNGLPAAIAAALAPPGTEPAKK